MPMVEDIESSESSDSVKKIYQFFDWDGDGKLEMEDIKNKCGSWLNAISYMYDVSLDNIPLGAIIGLTITIISSILISSGVNNSSAIIFKYNEELNNFTNYYYLSLAAFILLHTAIFLHGFSIFILETRREICQISEVGCYCCCKNKKSKLGKGCRCFQKCAQKRCPNCMGCLWNCFNVYVLFFYYSVLCNVFIRHYCIFFFK